jgi:hypothetical protein
MKSSTRVLTSRKRSASLGRAQTKPRVCPQQALGVPPCAPRQQDQPPADNRIADVALQAIRCLTTVSAEGIQIRAHCGEVILSGVVTTRNQRNIIEEVVAYQPGVKKIVNLLSIEPERELQTKRFPDRQSPAFHEDRNIFRELCEESD